MTDLVERARELAHRAHAGQVDKAGRPYIEHVRRVAKTVAAAGDDVATAVAWLHDTLEDTSTTLLDLDMQISIEVGGLVLMLTRYDWLPDAAYYAVIRRHPIALRVKLADIADNADEARLALLDEATAARLRRKYAKAQQALQGGGA